MEKTYELCVLFGGNLADAEIEKQAGEVSELVKAAGVRVTFSASVGKRKLAYAINGHTSGDYRVWYFVAAPESVPGLNEKLRLSSVVARHLIAVLQMGIAESRIAKIREGKSTVAEAPARTAGWRRTGDHRAADARKSESPEHAPLPAREVKKTSLEDLDKKLDEILESDKL